MGKKIKLSLSFFKRSMASPSTTPTVKDDGAIERDGVEDATNSATYQDKLVAQQFLQSIPMQREQDGQGKSGSNWQDQEDQRSSDELQSMPIVSFSHDQQHMDQRGETVPAMPEIIPSIEGDIDDIVSDKASSLKQPSGDMSSKNEDALRFLMSISVTQAPSVHSNGLRHMDIYSDPNMSDVPAMYRDSSDGDIPEANNLILRKVDLLPEHEQPIPARKSIWFVSHKRMPIGIYSISPFETKKFRPKKKRSDLHANMESRIMAGLESLRKKKAESYGHLLHPSGLEKNDAIIEPYDPYILDDPDLRAGKHRTIITLPSYLGSIVHYSRSRDLKNEINSCFRKNHPELDPSLTLSQIRSVKRRLFDAALELNMELSSVAKAYAFFEKLVLKNRRLVGGICMFLACKVNDNKQINYVKIAECLGQHLSISAREIREQEFSIFAALEFNLQIPPEEYSPHFERIFAFSDYSNIQEYLGEVMYKEWQSCL